MRSALRSAEYDVKSSIEGLAKYQNAAWEKGLVRDKTELARLQVASPEIVSVDRTIGEEF